MLHLGNIMGGSPYFGIFSKIFFFQVLIPQYPIFFNLTCDFEHFLKILIIMALKKFPVTNIDI